MNAIKGIILALCIIAGALFAMRGGARAECIYVDSEYGSDSNAGTQYAPVATWARAIELGAADATTALWWADGDTPDVDTARLIVNAKDDVEIVERRRTQISGHGALPVECTEASATAGMLVRTVRVWIKFSAANGQEAEHETDPIVTVEVF